MLQFYEDALGCECKLIVMCAHCFFFVSLPSVSFLGTDKSSSLATCLCPNDPTKGIDEGVSDDVCAWFDVVVDDSDGGKSGLHGEWELAEVLVDAAIGTPAADGYKSWLNCERNENRNKNFIDHASHLEEDQQYQSLILFFMA